MLLLMLMVVEFVEGKGGRGRPIQPLVGAQELRAGAVDSAVRIEVQMIVMRLLLLWRLLRVVVVVVGLMLMLPTVMGTTITTTAKMVARLMIE